MDLPGRKDDALAQPTRARIYELLVEARESLSTGEIALALGMHVNGVRRHLERLAEAGLAERRRERQGRGRPGDRWVVSPEAKPGGIEPTAYLDLAVWLARSIPADDEAAARVEATGFEVGTAMADELDGLPGASRGETFRDALAAIGFQPVLEGDPDGEFACRLENCPFAESAAANPTVVCSLHRGLTAGLLDGIDPTAEMTGFVKEDPHRAGCLVTVK